jgi:predicted DCC family thiol-disulfide oxidoreductase YuxK
VCNLCNSAVRFIIKRDPAKNLLFCSVQSPKAEPYLRG